ncbi:esterase [Paralcaligenes ureilyticus]|uniref:Phospholipase/carboxylesterase n=1 Tax=Paralcaligenes ureilyticus TaxID=627131 RepID=A0A4V2UZ96_9BURK|nr:esterase [Paralcaligenes ureilyticus]TCT10408.1 phospholipase/carboxylesterase [Paralcaligenes ureilyticus]
MSILEPRSPDPLIFSPEQGKPQQLFVLLHGEAAGPQQLLPLAQAIKKVFANALVVLPCGPVRLGDNAYHWLESGDLGEARLAAGVARALPDLITQIRRLQAQYGLSNEQTALAGFSYGATMVLEASVQHADLAGRVLAFSGRYASLPEMAPAATTLHLLHGADDTLIPVSHARAAHARLAELRGDATLDIASTVGHELHVALIDQAIYRLQTCVPLRRWEAALGELTADDQTGDQGHSGGGQVDRRTLH